MCVFRRVSPLSQDTGRRTVADSIFYRRDDVRKSNRLKVASSAATTLTWKPGAGGVGSALAARASSDGDVLAGVGADEAAGAAAGGRSSRVLSSASALLGRFVTQTRQRLTTVSGAEWRRRCDAAVRRKQIVASSDSFYDDPNDRGTPSRQPDEEEPGHASCELRLPSSSGSVESAGSRRRSQRRVANASTSSSQPADAAVLDVPATATSAGAAWDHGALQRTRSSKHRPTVRRYPSVERLDLPRRQLTPASDRSPFGADRKRAERFRRQYIDVKLQRQPAPLQRPSTATKSMPTGVDLCGTTRPEVVACPQLLRVPATASVTLT